jgi:hypothetical protein
VALLTIETRPDLLIGVTGRLVRIPNMFARFGHIDRGVSDRRARESAGQTCFRWKKKYEGGGGGAS